MIIVVDAPAGLHQTALNTNDDFDMVSGISSSPRLYYLLYAGQNGAYIDDAAATQILDAFLHVIHPAPPWLSVAPIAGSTPEAVAFPTEDGLTAHAFFYRPRNRDYSGQPDQRHVQSHDH